MITGSIASSLYGEPRLTHDIDVVIAIQKPSVDRLVEAFPAPDFYLNRNSIIDAIDRQGTFNLIDVREGSKVDFWILTPSSFDQSRFSRRLLRDIAGTSISVSTPEDTILAKLRWAKLSGGSEKQFVDALRVYEVQFEKLNKEYLESWAKKLEVESMWERLKEEAEVI